MVCILLNVYMWASPASPAKMMQNHGEILPEGSNYFSQICQSVPLWSLPDVSRLVQESKASLNGSSFRLKVSVFPECMFCFSFRLKNLHQSIQKGMSRYVFVEWQNCYLDLYFLSLAFHVRLFLKFVYTESTKHIMKLCLKKRA